MICHRCLRCLPSRPSSTRTLSTLPYLRSPSTVSSSPTHSTPRPATSTSAAQPFSTPFTPSVPPLPTPASDDGLKIRSSVPAGTRLTGLGYLKNKEVPVAKEDGEYPAWLWGLLERGGKDGEKGMDGGDVEEGDMFSKSKKQRRIAMKAARKAAALNPSTLAPKIPLEHQSIDLPAGDGTALGSLGALKAREELRGAMRRGRRKDIKDANFLKGMK